MSDETVSLLIELGFTVTAIAVAAVHLLRRRAPGPAQDGPTPTWRELMLTAAGLVPAAVGPNILVVATTPGMPEMHQLVHYALVPSLVLLAVVWALSGLAGMDRLTNRIWTGIWTGAAATGALDAIRLTGFHLGLMPGNMPRMFGVLIFDRMALGPSVASDIIGYLYHYWAGACFGLTYTLLCGRLRWWGGLVWGLVIEVGMMVTPPMVVAMDTGYFGLKFGFGLLGTSFLAHVAFGTVLGLLAERYVRHRGTIFGLMYNRFQQHQRGDRTLEPPCTTLKGRNV